MNRPLWDLVTTTTSGWATDPESGVVWAGELEGRLGVRIVQDCREATTIWFDCGEITLRFEAYLFGRLDDPTLHRRFLKFNHTSWPAFVSFDRRDDIYVTGRVPAGSVDQDMLGVVIGAVHDGVERLFHQCVEAARPGRER